MNINTTFIRCLEELNRVGVSCYFFHRPAMVKAKFYDKNARYRMRHRISFPKIAENPSKYREVYKCVLGEAYDDKEIEKLSAIPPVIKQGGRVCHANVQSEYVNVENGYRKTAYQTEEKQNRIFMYGRCGVFGYAVKDEEPVPSQLQKKLSEEGISDYSVKNRGLWGADTESIISNFITDVKKKTFHENDVIIFYMHKLKDDVMDSAKKAGMYYENTTEEFHTYDASKGCFYDKPGHMNAAGYKIIADIIYKKLQATSFQKQCVELPKREEPFEYSDEIEITEEMEQYITQIKNRVELPETAMIGSIIMNCNPFTLGHRYLIETARKQVDILLIFVLQEDRSEFSFSERYQLVKAGTKDLENVFVVPSGKFIISAITFPEYFLKSQKKSMIVDTTRDLEVFGKYIAKELHIKKRFVGEEPIDMVTNQYNQNMKKVLPKYGIEVIEIPRKEVENQGVISASKVRKMMKEDSEELRKFVPETTYSFLQWRKNNVTFYSLSNGMRIPKIGFGTFPMKEELEEVIPKAVKAGYRMFDTSDNYHNESYLGKTLEKSQDLEKNFLVVTKISKPQKLLKFSQEYQKSQERLKHKIDLFLMHWPYPFVKYNLWREMESLYENGACGGIGVCNFTNKEMIKLLEKAKVKPLVNQIELHPMFQQRQICEFCEENGIKIMAYSPLARMDKRLMENELLKSMAEKYGKSVPQIILRWDVQHGYIPIPSGKKEEHLIANIDIDDFLLTEEDMQKIDSLDCGMRVRFDPDKRFNAKYKIAFWGINVIYATRKKFVKMSKSMIGNLKFLIKYYLKQLVRSR